MRSGGYSHVVTSPPLATPEALSPASAPRTPGAQRVLEAALDLFATHGFDGTSLQEIADRLGITKAAVYYHFRTKDELLLALVRPALDELIRLVEINGARVSRQRSRDIEVAGYVDYLLRHRRLAGYLVRDAAAMSRPAVLELTTRLRGKVESMLLGDGADDLGAVWGGATLQALTGALLAAPADVTEDWLREELTEITEQMLAGYRKAVRRRGAMLSVG
ncbi:MAG: TetR/AcrR family transcriptional regulator [Blastococcus sp.]|nr:TetR/AcrR family transcriptional regulator [Blastococcus sp.]